jgi:tetratricopeptide (TPR) repeat protein
MFRDGPEGSSMRRLARTILASAIAVGGAELAARTAAVPPTNEARRSAVDALLARADVWLDQGNLDAALDGYRQVLEIDPDNVMAHRGAGFALMELGRPEEGVPDLRDAIRLDPTAHRAWENLGLAYAATYDRITDSLKRISLRPGGMPSEPDPLWKHAQGLNEKLKSFDFRTEAIAAMREAARLEPTEPKYWYNLGTTLMQYRRSQLAAATEALMKAVELDPSYYAALRNLEGSLEDQRLFKDAWDLCLRMEQTFGPQDAWLQLHLAGLSKEMGDLNEAEQRLNRVLELGGDASVVHLELAKVFKLRHDDERAQQHLQEAVRLSPDHERVMRQEFDCER